MSWLDGPLHAFDTETTGKDPDECRLVTATLIRLEKGTEPIVKTWLADPGVEIPAEATAIHNITTAVAREFGRPAAEVVSEIRLKLAEAWAEGPVVMYNASFDCTVVHRECARHTPGLPFEVTGDVLDGYILDKALDRYRKGSRTLTETCKHYGVRLDGAHNATEDALAAYRVMWKIARTVRLDTPAARYLIEHTPDEIHRMTARMFADQQTRFAEYLSTKVAAGITDDTERAEVLERAATIRADLNGWPIRGAA